MSGTPPTNTSCGHGRQRVGLPARPSGSPYQRRSSDDPIAQIGEFLKFRSPPVSDIDSEMSDVESDEESDLPRAEDPEELLDCHGNGCQATYRFPQRFCAEHRLSEMALGTLEFCNEHYEEHVERFHKRSEHCGSYGCMKFGTYHTCSKCKTTDKLCKKHATEHEADCKLQTPPPAPRPTESPAVQPKQPEPTTRRALDFDADTQPMSDDVDVFTTEDLTAEDIANYWKKDPVHPLSPSSFDTDQFFCDDESFNREIDNFHFSSSLESIPEAEEINGPREGTRAFPIVVE